MSLITQCPTCKTMFKVVADQLQVSAGWVRCGQCQEVFDANAHLQAEPPPLAPLPDEAAAISVGLSESAPHAPMTQTVQPSQSLPDEPVGVEPEPEPEFEPEPMSSSLDEPIADVGKTEPYFPEPEPSAGAPRVNKDRPLSFLRKARRPARRSSAWERAAWLLIILFLTGGLLVQVVAQERDLIAAHHPAFKPWLEEFCDALKCRLRTLRQIDAVAIESSTFLKVRQDYFQLNFTLKNTGAVPVALPAIELSLTDVHDQPVVRKVLREQDLGLHANVLQAQSQNPGSVMLRLNTAGVSERVAGYRILAFYP